MRVPENRAVERDDADLLRWTSQRNFRSLKVVPRATDNVDMAGTQPETKHIESGFVGELRSRFGTVEMPASDALDLQSLTMTFWKARTEPIVSL